MPTITNQWYDCSNNNIVFTVDTSDNYLVTFTMNSNHKDLLNVQINDDNNTNVFSHVKKVYYTGIMEKADLFNTMNETGDPFFARQTVHIGNPIYLEANKNFTLTYEINRPIHIYAIDLEPYNNDKYKLYTQLTFRPEHVENSEIEIINYNNYCLIPNMSAYFGGLWWCIGQALTGVGLCIKHNLIPVIDYEGGLYHANKYYDPSDLPASWWNYYFEDPVKINKLQKERLIEYSQTNRQIMNFTRPMRNREQSLRPINEKNMYVYIRSTYNMFMSKILLRNAKQLCKQYLRPLPYIKEYCDNFWKNTKNVTRIGVHFRGTDKYATGTTSEGHPIHYEYSKVVKMIQMKLTELNIGEYIVYVTSDESPFIEFMQKELKDMFITNDHTIRSDTCTSGQDIADLKQIRFSKTNNADIQKIYDENKGTSIHFGKKDTSNYLKGLYSVIDCILLSQCNHIFCSRGNFSDFAKYMSDESTLVYDMNELYKSSDI